MECDHRWAEPDLSALDGLRAEILVGSLGSDERPPAGVCGLMDWRLEGRITRLCETGVLTGARGERLLLMPRVRLSAERVLIWGLGPVLGSPTSPDDADPAAAYLEAIDDLARVLGGLRVQAAAIELPGRHLEKLPAVDAVTAWLAALDAHPHALRSVILIDRREAHGSLDEARRRRNRARVQAQARSTPRSSTRG